MSCNQIGVNGDVVADSINMALMDEDDIADQIGFQWAILCNYAFQYIMIKIIKFQTFLLCIPEGHVKDAQIDWAQEQTGLGWLHERYNSHKDKYYTLLNQ